MDPSINLTYSDVPADDILDDLAGPAASFRAIAHAHNTTAPALAQWLQTPEIARRLSTLSAAVSDHTQLAAATCLVPIIRTAAAIISDFNREHETAPAPDYSDHAAAERRHRSAMRALRAGNLLLRLARPNAPRRIGRVTRNNTTPTLLREGGVAERLGAAPIQRSSLAKPPANATAQHAQSTVHRPPTPDFSRPTSDQLLAHLDALGPAEPLHDFHTPVAMMPPVSGLSPATPAATSAAPGARPKTPEARSAKSVIRRSLATLAGTPCALPRAP